YFLYVVFLPSARPRPHLHSFPTRRSSDLAFDHASPRTNAMPDFRKVLSLKSKRNCDTRKASWCSGRDSQQPTAAFEPAINGSKGRYAKPGYTTGATDISKPGFIYLLVIEPIRLLVLT